MSSNELFHDKKSVYLQTSPVLTILAGVGILLGIGAAAFGFVNGQGTRVWGAYLFNLFFFFALGLGAMALAAITDVVGATWNRPIRRIQEAFGAFVPVGCLLFLVLLGAIAGNILEAGSIYKWMSNPKMLDHFWGKNMWLTPPGFYVRVPIYLVIIGGVVLWQLSLTTRRDKAWVEGRHDDAEYLGEVVRFKTKFWSAPLLLLLGITFTFLCFDVTMSLSPLWFSTLWGGWQFAVMMQTLMASLLITMFAIKNSPLGAYIKRQQFHDVGKLMHGFTVFFAYLTYAHILTYWYGNIPEETEYFIHRMHGTWLVFVCIVPIIAFVIPLYTLIFKAAKWTAIIAVPIAILILFGQWLTYLILVQPEVMDYANFFKPIPFPVVEVGMFLGMFGLFVLTFVWFAKRYPMLPVADPLLRDALSDEHH